jgi:poly(hydroxyalkanoate) depolymerase family esterase
MKRTLALVALLLAATVGGLAPARAAGTGSLTRHTLPPTADYPARDYLLYVPANVAPNPAVITFLHGCAQTADEAAGGVGWNELADSQGFVVVYPEQHVPVGAETDGSAARCWNSGQVVLARGQGELESVAQITRTVASTYSGGPSYLIGISGGALMGSVMAATYPDLYDAFASVAGCSYLCSDPTGDVAYTRMGAYARVMPTIVFTGTTDDVTIAPMGELTVTQWLGTNDRADDGAHNLSISPVPSSVEQRNLDSLTSPGPATGDACLHDFPRNPCPLGAVGVAPYPSTVRQYHDTAGRTVVEAWLIHGVLHNYSGGSYGGTFTDPNGPDITGAAWAFFTHS